MNYPYPYYWNSFLRDIAARQLAALQEFGILQIGDVTDEPISLAEARAQCNVDLLGSPPESDHDFWFENIGIPGARGYCETYMGVAYAARTMELTTNTFPSAGIDLPFGPVQSIISVKYLDDAAAAAAYIVAYDAEFLISADVGLATAAGVAAAAAALEQTMDPADYVLDVYVSPARLILAYGATWPTARDQTNSVKVRYVAGYNLPTDSPLPYPLPPTVRMAMLMMLSHLFANREAVNVGNIVTEMDLGVKALLDLSPGRERLGMA